MAAIDKCYVNNYGDYLAFEYWAKDKSFVTPRGCKVYLKDYIYAWNEEHFSTEKSCSLPIFNTPTYVDNYLYHNCPLKFVQDWLRDRYLTLEYRKGNAPEIQDELHLPVYEPCTKVTVIQKGCKVNARRGWYIDIDPIDNGFFWYNEDQDFWVLPEEIDVYSCSAAHLKCSIRTIIRKIIKKWKLPKGIIVRVDGLYEGENWVLKTK